MARLAAFLLLVLACAPGARAEKVRKPEIWERDSWGAGPARDLADDFVKTRIVLHHTAALVTDADKRLEGRASWERAVSHAKAAQKLHRHIRGWKDVGYHYMIDWEGRILEGRPVDMLGAHVEKHNTGSVGIVLMGNLSRQRATTKQLASLKALVNWLVQRFDIPEDAISGHYQMKHTTCPGAYLNNVWKGEAPRDYVQIGAPAPKARRQAR